MSSIQFLVFPFQSKKRAKSRNVEAKNLLFFLQLLDVKIYFRILTSEIRKIYLNKLFDKKFTLFENKQSEKQRQK